MTDTRVTPTLTRADVEALRSYLVTSRRPVGAVLAYCATLLRTDLVGNSVLGEAVLTCVEMERLRWKMELDGGFGHLRTAARVEPMSLRHWEGDPLARLGPAQRRDDIVLDVLNDRAARMIEAVRPTVHEPDGLPAPQHLEVVHPGRTRAGEPEPAEALRRRIVTLLACDTLTAWQLKTVMQVPYQDVLRALLVLEGRGVARRIVDAGHPDLWALVNAGN